MNPSPTPHFPEDKFSAATELRRAALHWLVHTDSAAKAAGVRAMSQAWHAGNLVLDRGAALSADAPVPGRPAQPELVSPLLVKSRSM